MTTWGQLHAGDTVRGADGRVWEIAARREGLRWVIGGAAIEFMLRLGSAEITISRNAAHAAPVVAIAERRELVDAAGALIGAGLSVEVIEEKTVSDTDYFPATVDATPASKATETVAQPAVRATEPRMDRYDRYLLPDPTTGKERAWTRASTVARTLADEYHLTRWKMRMVAKGLALRPDLVAGAAAADPDVDKSTLNGIADQAMDRAGAAIGRNMGQAFHTFAQRLDGGEPLAALGVPAPLDVDLKAYVDMLRAARLTVLAPFMERIVVLPELGVAGTLDRLVARKIRTNENELSVLDLKSGKTVVFSWLEWAIQQALYARATHMWDAAHEVYLDMPPVNQDRALIAHVPIGRGHAQLYGLNIIEGWRAVAMAMEVRKLRTAASRGWSWLIEPDDRESVAIHNVSRASSREELSALWEQLHPQGLWSEQVNAAAAVRWTQLQEAMS